MTREECETDLMLLGWKVLNKDIDSDFIKRNPYRKITVFKDVAYKIKARHITYHSPSNKIKKSELFDTYQLLINYLVKDSKYD